MWDFIRFPLRSMWKARDIKINNISVLPITNAEHVILHISNLTTEVTQDWEDSKLINLGHRDTSGALDSVTNIRHGFTNTSHVGGQPMTSNFGARNRARLFNGGAIVKVIDTLDTVCFNENRTDKFIPSDFDIQLVFHGNETFNTLADMMEILLPEVPTLPISPI